VLKAGPDSIDPGTTVLVERDEKGDEDDQPLSLTLIKPTKPKARAKKGDEEKEPVAVGAKSEGDTGPKPPSPDQPAAGDGTATEAD
jgi:hypothetical protein